ncbi:MAG: hypothetical protein J7K72_04285 [Candidatus Aenigmarchaeota archaeon]|nr:hypothetical protein [Candidatus Aenigmarchaeota archaeon]
MGNRIITFVKFYIMFFIFAILVNLSLEIAFRFVLEIPEKLDIMGIIMFFIIFSLLGALVLFFKRYSAVKMGILSLIIGHICEFTFMRPEWVQNIYSLKIGMDVVVAFVVSSVFYWFPAWLIPSYVINRIYQTKN